jgi:molecular chaperone DnaJ
VRAWVHPTLFHLQFVFAGADVAVAKDIPFATSVFGGQVAVNISVHDPCSACKGTGNKGGAVQKECPACDGAGRIVDVQRTKFGVLQSTRTCPKCRGTGMQILDQCTVCQGSGVSAELGAPTQLAVTVPAGMATGTKVVVPNAGHAGIRGGAAGDVIVEIRPAQDPLFRCEGNNICSELRISYLDAILGKKLMVPSVDGPVELIVPAGVQPGQKLRLKGKGVPIAGRTSLFGGAARGDALITVIVSIPTAIGEKQRALLTQLRDGDN